jgi:hypothetical protein
MKATFLFLFMMFQYVYARQVMRDTIPFTWLGHYEAMLIQVQPPGASFSKKNFYMQFDLGSPHTLLYQNEELGFAGDSVRQLPQLPGNRAWPVRAAAVTPMKATDSIVGTIGSDWLMQQVLILDFRTQQLVLTNTVPKNYDRSLQTFHVTSGRLLFPGKLGNGNGVFIYDSGSSAFGLLTDSATAVAMAEPSSTAIMQEHNSWGHAMQSHTYPTRATITLAGQTILLKNVSWISGATANQINQMKRLGIVGMLGNLPFLQSILVLDMKSNRFGLF